MLWHGLRVSGAAATTLGTNSTFLTRLMEWCTVEDHAGVKGSLSMVEKQDECKRPGVSIYFLIACEKYLVPEKDGQNWLLFVKLFKFWRNLD